MLKISIIGAGSMEFSKEIMTDVLLSPELEQGTFALVDVDNNRLELAHQMAEYLIKLTGRDWNVEASTDRNRVIENSDFVINTIEVAGLPNVRHDYEIPLKYGIDQCIGDTIGPGGLFKSLRTLPSWVQILKDVENLAPRAVVMNYTNPMSLTVLTGLRASKLQIIGLCHSIQHTLEQISFYLNIPSKKLIYEVAGINHLAFFTKLEYQGEDMYPLLREKARTLEIYEQDPVRFEMMLHLGYFSTEGSGHASEYTAYFRKRPDLVKKYDRGGYLGESGFYANNWPEWRNAADDETRRILAGEKKVDLKRGPEYASYIIESMKTGHPITIYGNVINENWIDNLPKDGIVEVACEVDSEGIQPIHYGKLPTQLALVNQQHMAFHDLAATAILMQDREAAIHALMCDPLTSAVCSLEEIRKLFNDMVKAEKEYLPEFLYE